MKLVESRVRVPFSGTGNIPSIGSEGEYAVKGFNLLHLDEAGKIYEDDSEFNSIAWALDDGRLGRLYC
jgi:hypothetical protein